MKFLVKYKLFENLQQAEKIEKTISNENIEDWKKTKEWAIKNGYSNYLGWIAEKDIYSYNHSFLKKSLDLIKKHKIDLYSPEYKNLRGYEVLRKVDQLEENQIYISFINKWCPASLRSSVKENLDKFREIKAANHFITINKLQNPSSSDKLALQKGSRAKTADEWIDIVRTIIVSDDINLDDIKNSNIRILKEDDTHLIYEPLDFKSYKVANYKHWCLMSEVMWYSYTKRGKVFIMLNKNIKEKSLVCTYDVTKKDLIISDYPNREVKLIRNGVDETHFKDYQYPEDIDKFLQILKKSGINQSI